MKTSTLKKSLLDYAIKGSLSSRFRRENPNLNALSEIQAYNENIAKQRKTLQKEIQKLEKELDSIKPQKQESKEQKEQKKEAKENLKKQIRGLEKQRQNLKTIQILKSPHCESSFLSLRVSETNEAIQNINNNKIDCHEANASRNDNSAFTPPFTIPPTWVWVRLGDICEMKKGPFGSSITKDMFIPKSKDSIKIYEQKNAIQKDQNLGDYYISMKHFEKLKQFEVFEDDIIVSCAGTIGEIFRIPKDSQKGIINQALMKMRLKNLDWIPYFLICFDFLLKEKSQKNSKGSAIKNIPPLDILKNFPIPLPPLKEQEFLAKKLDELIHLATDFDNTKEELKRIEKRIEKSLLKLAIEGGLSKAFRQRHPSLNALSEIQAYNENIQKQKKALQKELKSLESAFKQEKDKEAKKQINQEIKELKTKIAKLQSITPLFPNDTNSSPLKQNFTQGLNAILTLDDKNTTSKELENYNFQTFSPPFSIPPTWLWVRLGDICEITMGQSPESNQVIEKSLLNSKFVISRPLRGAENRNQGGSSASADLELEAEKARLSPISEKAVAFLRAGERGGGEALFAKKENNDYEYIEFHQGKIAFGEKFIQESNFFAKSTLKIATPDSVLLCVRAPVGIVNITQRAIGIGRGLCALKSEFCDNLFLYYVLQSMQRYFESKATGSTFKAINIDIIKETLIPLPPLKEQAHIVALLDKLFVLSRGLRVR